MTMAISGIIDQIDVAFQNRKMPTGRIISQNFDLNYHIEAKRVDAYIRERYNNINRSNSALVAFNYLTADAALFMMPKYMRSTMENFEDDDFILAVIAGALASGMPGALYTSQDDLGVRMKKLATTAESESIHHYIIWLQDNTCEIGLDETLVAADKLWNK